MITAINEDINGLHVDAIMNAANLSLLGVDDVDGAAIHRVAGKQLLEFNRTLGGCKTVKHKLSPGFNLRANWIIHTVILTWRGGIEGEKALLTACYQNYLKLALAHGVISMAFPCISRHLCLTPLIKLPRLPWIV